MFEDGSYALRSRQAGNSRPCDSLNSGARLLMLDTEEKAERDEGFFHRKYCQRKMVSRILLQTRWTELDKESREQGRETIRQF